MAAFARIEESHDKFMADMRAKIEELEAALAAKKEEAK
jgi:hypothetical protein